MLSNELTALIYFVADRVNSDGRLSANDATKLLINIESCRDQAKQYERAIAPNCVTLQAQELTGNVVMLPVARRPTPRQT